ncbi:MAG: hypothetical protein GX597_04480 [Anaerolineaceae bacterium]|nr:hypothetical protein [Anaerolineaceae bacterium]
MRRKLWLLVLVAGALLLAPGRARACLCAAVASPGEEMARSAAVLAGRVLRIDAPQGAMVSTGDPVHVVFQVERVWKGPAVHNLVIVTARHSVSCGFPFEVGEEYLVYARAVEGELHTSICSRTAPLSAVAEDLVALGPGMAMAPAEPEPPAGRWRGVLPLLLVAAAVVTAAVLIVRAARQARQGGH